MVLYLSGSSPEPIKLVMFLPITMVHNRTPRPGIRSHKVQYLINLSSIPVNHIRSMYTYVVCIPMLQNNPLQGQSIICQSLLKLLSTTELCFRVMKGLNMKLVNVYFRKKEVTCHMILKDFISPYSSQ